MKRSRQLVLSAALAALICLLTTFLRLPVPVPQGYIHLGDVAIFLGAMLMGHNVFAAAGIGSALADLLSGFALYAPVTALVKALMGLMAGYAVEKTSALWQRGLLFLLCGTFMALGYFCFEWPVYGWAAALSALLPNLLQGWISAGLSLLLWPVASRVRIAIGER